MIAPRLLSTLRVSLVVASLASCSAALAQQTPADRQDAALAYAQCVRDHGYAEFPDPDTEGGFKFLIKPDSVSRFKAAADACRDLAPEGMRDNDITPQQLDALIKLAQCVRENGIPDFPDPNAQGRFEFGNAKLKPGDAAFEAAMAACRDVAQDAPIMIGG